MQPHCVIRVVWTELRVLNSRVCARATAHAPADAQPAVLGVLLLLLMCPLTFRRCCRCSGLLEGEAVVADGCFDTARVQQRQADELLAILRQWTAPRSGGVACPRFSGSARFAVCVCMQGPCSKYMQTHVCVMQWSRHNLNSTSDHLSYRSWRDVTHAEPLIMFAHQVASCATVLVLRCSAPSIMQPSCHSAHMLFNACSRVLERASWLCQRQSQIPYWIILVIVVVIATSVDERRHQWQHCRRQQQQPVAII